MAFKNNENPNIHVKVHSAEYSSMLRKSYYEKMREQVSRIVGRPSKELKNYTHQYETELENCQFKHAGSSQFFKAIETGQILLVGDFHAQPQSARSLLRICRKLGGKNIVLVLECFRSSDQKHINNFLNGDLSEIDFLNAIDWKNSWSFPWSSTKSLMRWAMLNQVPVFGMNLQTQNITLKKRDQHFSKTIIQIQAKNKNRAVLVQVGDFHLAKKHLPAELRKANKKIRVHSIYQSPDQLYFKITKKNTDFLDLKNNRWAIMTVVPWVKWQEYLLYLESGQDRIVQSNQKDESDDFDILDHVVKFIQLVSHTLQIEIQTSDLNVYTAYDPKLKKAIRKLDSKIRQKVNAAIQAGQSFYIPELKTGVVSRLTVNHISRLAAHIILVEKNVYNQTVINTKNNFLKLIWIEMLTYFISKIANPKRKTDTLKDIRNALNSASASASVDDKGKEALVLCLEQKMKEIQYVNSQHIVNRKPARRSSRLIQGQSYFVASQLIGGILGEKIFYAFVKKIIQFPMSNNFLFKSVNHKNFEASYYEAIEIIDSWPLPFKSKYDQF